jgi:hypothetical protein
MGKAGIPELAALENAVIDFRISQGKTAKIILFDDKVLKTNPFSPRFPGLQEFLEFRMIYFPAYDLF